jgi:hypothetical protein
MTPKEMKEINQRLVKNLPENRKESKNLEVDLKREEINKRKEKLASFAKVIYVNNI